MSTLGKRSVDTNLMFMSYFRPQAHLFGHAHGRNGVVIKSGILFSNAAMRLSGGGAKVIDVHLKADNKGETHVTPVHYGNVEGKDERGTGGGGWGKGCSIM